MTIRAASGAPPLRAWCGLLAFGVAALAAYVSLVPFRFSAPESSVSVVDLLWTQARIGSVLSGNGLANLVMFVPFGFGGLGALVTERSRWWQWLLGAVTVGAASIAVSVTIEALQIYVPGRTPALTDVVAQTAGTAVGMLAWVALAPHVRAAAGRLRSGQTSGFRFALGTYTACLALYLVLPFDLVLDLDALAERLRDGHIVLNPLQSPTLSPDLLPSVISDFVMASPVGVFMLVAGRADAARRTGSAAFGWAALLFGSGEAIQAVVLSRTADVVDLGATLAGAAAGVAVGASLLDWRFGPASGARGARVAIVSSLTVLALLHAAYNLIPFDFNFSPDFVAGRIGRFLAVPFAGYYQNPEFKALSDLTVKLSMSVPFGVLAQLLSGGRAPGRLATALFLSAAAVFFTAVELGQVLLPSRYPDNTDVLIAVFGVWAGMTFTRRFQGRLHPGPVPQPLQSPDP